MEFLKRMPLPVRAALASLALVLAAFALELCSDVLPDALDQRFEKFASNAVFIGAALVCGWRSLAIRRERLAWGLFAVGLLAWGLGDLYFTVSLWNLEEIPLPSPADAGYLALYPPVYAGLALLVHSRVVTTDRSLWVDGVIAALALGALSATLLFDAIVASTGG